MTCLLEMNSAWCNRSLIEIDINATARIELTHKSVESIFIDLLIKYLYFVIDIPLINRFVCIIKTTGRDFRSKRVAIKGWWFSELNKHINTPIGGAA